jgi:hypothetical protein
MRESADAQFCRRPEHQVLILALSHKKGAEAELRTALSQGLDYRLLLQGALRHNIFPSFYRRLVEVGLEQANAEYFHRMRELYRQNARRNLSIVGELLKIMALLEGQGIEAIPFKGPVLAALAYGDPSLRQFEDLDILVSRKNIEKVRDLLVGKGYQLRYSFTKKMERLHLEYGVELTFEHPRWTMLDVHWRFAADYLGGGLDPEKALARRMPVQILGKAVFTLHAEDNLLLLCQHGTTHSWLTLSTVSDVAQLIHSKQCWDWPRVLKRANDLGLRRQTLLGLSLAQEHLGAPVAPEVIEEADADPSVVGVRRWVAQNLWARNGEFLGFLEQTSFYLKTRDSFKDKVRHLWCRLAIPSMEDWRWAPLPDPLYTLYYVIRPLRLGFQGLIIPACRCLIK